MPIYPTEVNDRFLNPQFTGRATAENAVGTSAGFECGCYARISMSIGVESRKISDVKFQSNGCGFMIASADVLAEHLNGRDLTGLHSVDEPEFAAIVRQTFIDLPTERVHCVQVVVEAIRAAFSDFRSYLIEEFQGEKPLICTCFGVAEESVEKYISENRPASVEDVTAACRAGGGCGSCRMLIQEIIDQAVRADSSLGF